MGESFFFLLRERQREREREKLTIMMIHGLMRSNGRHLLRSLLKGPQQAECNSPRAHHRFILTVPSPLTSAPFIMHNPTIDDELNRSRCLSSFLPAHRVVNF